jgi:hypothetical protein
MSIYVVNTNTGGISEYTGISYSVLIESNGTTYGVNSDGLYKFTGDSDSGSDIDAHITTGYINLNSNQLKRFNQGSIIISYESDETGKLTLYNSTDGVDDTDYYDVSITATYPEAFRPVVWDGMKARYWKFKLENTSGADFRLEDWYINPVFIGRQIK